MQRLEAEFRTAVAEGMEPALVLALSGSADPATVGTLEEALDRAADDGKGRVIFDLHGLKYINSTSMGMLVQFVDTLREKNGQAVLMRVQPKVLLVLEMLGLQTLFRIVRDEAEAMSALSGVEVATVTLEGREALPSMEEAPRIVAGEPQTADCPVCAARLLLASPGSYRCPRCRTVLQAEADGSVRSYPEATSGVAELTLPPIPGLYPAAMLAAAALAAKAGFDATVAKRAGEALAACLGPMADGLPKEGDRRLHVFLRATAGRWVARVYAGGPGADEGVFAAAREGVTRLAYQASPEGNLLTLECVKE